MDISRFYRPWHLLIATLGLAVAACGEPQSEADSQAADEAAEPVLETVAVLDRAPGNIGVAPDGTVIVSVHPSIRPDVVAVSIAEGESAPFPPGPWSTVLSEEMPPETPGMRPVLGVRADGQGLVWMLSGGSGQFPKHLYVWDRNEHHLAHDYQFDQTQARPRSFFNDIALAKDHGVVFISDPAAGSDAAIVVVDLESGETARKLEGHASVVAEDIALEIDGKIVGFPGPEGEIQPLQGALNPITIDGQEEWVYYAPMSGLSVYRIRVADLLNDDLSAEALGDRVERYGPKPASAGITIDDGGHVYITDVGNDGIGVTTPDGYRLLVRDETRLSWPDGLSVGPDGYIYVASNSLYRVFPSHAGEGPLEPPFYVTRFKALAPTTVGR